LFQQPFYLTTTFFCAGHRVYTFAVDQDDSHDDGRGILDLPWRASKVWVIKCIQVAGLDALDESLTASHSDPPVTTSTRRFRPSVEDAYPSSAGS
jgi:hypothetical protein